MKTQESVYVLLAENDIIYIDTCSLMQSENTESVIEEIRPYLLAVNKKILITAPVSHELMKHRIRKKEQTVHLVEKAYEIIEEYSDVFTLEDCESSKKEIFAAFADPSLIARMTLSKDHSSQLLITNDKKLSVDALNINTLKSCKGKPVTVYSITDSGELEEFKLPVSEQPKVLVTEQPPKKNNTIKEMARTLYLVSVGIMLGVGGKYAYRYSKTINWRAFV